MEKKCLRALGFAALLACTLFLAAKVFSFKYADGIYGMKKFYEQEEGTVDVLVLGPSLAFADVNTATLWEEYGISAFNLGGSIQPMWNTYYYLKEALKYQRPQVIILEASATNMMGDYHDNSRIIKNTFGMRWSKDKLEAIKISAPRKQWGEYIFSYVQYHSRYAKLTREDFLDNLGSLRFDDWKGFLCLMKTEPQEPVDVTGVAEREGFSPKTEDYYRKTIELAREEGIPLLVIVSPHAGISQWSQAVYNTAADIAQEYGIPFINYNLIYEDIGLDYATDMADALHLNYKGNQKYTRRLAEYLLAHYALEDHRGDGRYVSWEQNSRLQLAAISHQELAECTDITQMFPLLAKEDFDIAISVDGAYSEEDGNIRAFLEAFHIPSHGERGLWLVSQGEVCGLADGPQQVRQIRYPYHTLTLRCTWNQGEGIYASSIYFDAAPYKKVDNGVNVFLCSRITGEMVDAFGIVAGEDGVYR